MQETHFKNAIRYVSGTGKAVSFYRDMLGLQFKFESPGWSEFVSGKTPLALHPASEENPAGSCELDFTIQNVKTFFRDVQANGVEFSRRPEKQHFGGVRARFVDSVGAEYSVIEEPA